MFFFACFSTVEAERIMVVFYGRHCSSQLPLVCVEENTRGFSKVKIGSIISIPFFLSGSFIFLRPSSCHSPASGLAVAQACQACISRGTLAGTVRSACHVSLPDGSEFLSSHHVSFCPCVTMSQVSSVMILICK